MGQENLREYGLIRHPRITLDVLHHCLMVTQCPTERGACGLPGVGARCSQCSRRSHPLSHLSPQPLLVILTFFFLLLPHPQTSAPSPLFLIVFPILLFVLKYPECPILSWWGLSESPRERCPQSRALGEAVCLPSCVLLT